MLTAAPRYFLTPSKLHAIRIYYAERDNYLQVELVVVADIVGVKP
jgi:hypothetical protein